MLSANAAWVYRPRNRYSPTTVAVRRHPLHRDVVQVAGPVHGRAGVRLGRRSAAAAPAPAPSPRPAGWRTSRGRPGRAAGCRARCRAPPCSAMPAGPVYQVVLAVAEEGEVPVGQPAQQLGDLGRGSAEPPVVTFRGKHIVGQREGPGLHPRVVLDRDPYVASTRRRSAASASDSPSASVGSRCASRTRPSRRDHAGHQPRPSPGPRPRAARRSRPAGPAAAGCTTSRADSPWLASSMVIESTRNGMSSVTMSMTSELASSAAPSPGRTSHQGPALRPVARPYWRASAPTAATRSAPAAPRSSTSTCR